MLLITNKIQTEIQKYKLKNKSYILLQKNNFTTVSTKKFYLIQKNLLFTLITYYQLNLTLIRFQNLILNLNLSKKQLLN